MKKLLRFLALIMVLMMTFCTTHLSVAADDGYVTLNVTKSEIDGSGTSAIQNALNTARDNATESMPYKITVDSGSYNLTNALYIYSNTYLILDGVTLVRSSELKNNILRTGSVPEDTKLCGDGYTVYKNITVDGGEKGAVFDADNTETNTVVKMGHASNILLKNITVQNIKNGHLAEFAGIDGLTVQDCSFYNQILEQEVYKSKAMYEAVQLDILDESEHFSGFRSEDLPLKNVTFSNCSFSNSPRGIGSHTSILNQPFDNIVITGCTFTDMGSAAIQALNWVNSEISGNVIKNSPRGIAVSNVLHNGSCTMKASELAAEGDTVNHTNNDSFTEQTQKQNIVIKNNDIESGFLDDEYNTGYVKSGISVSGYTVTSGLIPNGNYYVNGVAISSNTIKTTRYGIKIDDARNITCSSNKITYTEKGETDGYGIYFGAKSSGCSASSNTISNAKIHGIFVSNSAAGNITSNTVTNAGDSGIYIYNSSSAGSVGSNKITNGAYGVRLSTSSKTSSVNSNTITNASKTAVYLYNKCQTGSVSSNTIKNGGYAIKLSTNSKATKISSNNITGTTGIIYVPSDCSATVSSNIALTKPSQTLSNTASGVLVKWKKISGASGYYILRKTEGSSSYSKIATVKGASTVQYTDKKASNGKKYYYAVQAYGTGIISSYSGKTIVRVSTPAISSATNKSGRKIYVKWNKISYADGYEVKYVCGSKSKVYNVPKGSTVSKTITGLTKGKTYKIYVRSYNTVSKTKSYSSWSSAKSVKIKK